MYERLPGNFGPSDLEQMSYWDIMRLMREAKRIFPDFWPPWQVSSWEEEEEREAEQDMTIERSYWEMED